MSRKLTNSEKRFEWIPIVLNKILDFLPEVLVLVAGLFVGLAGVPVAMTWVSSIVVKAIPDFTDGDAQVWSYIIGMLITVVNVIVTSCRRKSRSALELELQTLRDGRLADLKTLENVLDRAVEALSKDCGIWNSHTRASLYRHGAEAEKFIRVARVSDNPQLCKGGRKVYPDSQGLIETVWTLGEATVRDLPESRDEWNAKLVEDYGYDLPTASNLTMQSLSMVGVRLNYDHKQVGVVIVESKNPRGVKGKIIDDLQKSVWLERTAMLFAVSRENILTLTPENGPSK